MKRQSFLILTALLSLSVVAAAASGEGYVGRRPTPARLLALADALLGLGSTILAGRAWARTRRGSGQGGHNGARAALALGAIVVAYTIGHLAIFRGEFGTGSGRAGALVALALGLTGMLLAAITLLRVRRFSKSL